MLSGIFFRKPFQTFQNWHKNLLNFGLFAILAIFGAKWPFFWKFENFGPELRIQFWFFWKKFRRQNFLFVVCSLNFYNFFLNRNILKAFYHLILKILKKVIFLKKHRGFTPTLKFFLDFNVTHFKMTYRFSGVTGTTYIDIKHFFNTKKTFF